MKKENEEKYIIKRNNYIGLLFFALVLAASLYIIKHETSAFLDIGPKRENPKQIEETTRNIESNSDLIMDLEKYLNPGNINTRDIYQSMYIYNDIVKNEDFDDASALYTAYIYLNKTNTYEKRSLTCEEAARINLTNLKECNPRGTDTIENYKVQASIPKELMKSTVIKIFNRNLDTYPDFYINSKDKCYSLDESYLCLNGLDFGNTNTEILLITGNETNNTVEIIQIYKYNVSGIAYKGFNSKEVGEAKYKSIFKKVNGSYYWVSTEYIDN